MPKNINSNAAKSTNSLYRKFRRFQRITPGTIADRTDEPDSATETDWSTTVNRWRVAVPVPEKTPAGRDRMWECRTAHAHSNIPHLVRVSPRHPASVRKCSMWGPHGIRKINHVKTIF